MSKPYADDTPVTYGILRKELKKELKKQKEEIFSAMGEEFLEISQRMATKDDIKKLDIKMSKVLGIIADFMKRSSDQENENIVMTHQYQRATGHLENHEVRIKKIEGVLCIEPQA